jgi:hypothetical protein
MLCFPLNWPYKTIESSRGVKNRSAKSYYLKRAICLVWSSLTLDFIATFIHWQSPPYQLLAILCNLYKLESKKRHTSHAELPVSFPIHSKHNRRIVVLFFPSQLEISWLHIIISLFRNHHEASDSNDSFSLSIVISNTVLHYLTNFGHFFTANYWRTQFTSFFLGTPANLN